MRALFLIASVSFLFAWPASAKEPAREQKLPDLSLAEVRANLATHLAEPKFASAAWGVKVVSLDSGATLFETNAHKLLKPASNTKLYTAALAFDLLGPEFRIRTSVYSSNAPEPDGTLKGDLIIYGRGDPSFAARFEGGDYTHVLDRLVTAIRASGVKRVEGDLIGDATFFTGPPYGSGWAWDDLDYYYGAEVSALTLQDNVIDLFIKPGKAAGEPCQIATKPETTFVQWVNRTQTAAGQTHPEITIYRPLGGSQTFVWGTLPVTYGTWLDSVTVPHPALWFVTSLREALQREGVVVSGKIRARSWPEDEPLEPEHLHELAHVESRAISEIVEKTLKPSQNLYAQLLLLQVGAQFKAPAGANVTTEQAGLRELRRFIARVGIAPSEELLEDGSGLSRGGLVTANATVQLLAFMAKQKTGALFRDCLPEAGTDGTLKNRLPELKGNLRAKTGSLRFVTALSGYMDSRAGEHLAFSIMLNACNLSSARARAEVDVIPRLLMRLNENTGENSGRH